MKHRIDKSYKQWGWITPDNQILDGYASEFDTHCNLLRDEVNEDAPYHLPVYRGYVRWFTYSYQLNSEGEIDLGLNTEACSEERHNEAVKILRKFAMFNKTKPDSYYWNRRECTKCEGQGHVGESSSACPKCKGFGHILVENS